MIYPYTYACQVCHEAVTAHSLNDAHHHCPSCSRLTCSVVEGKATMKRIVSVWGGLKCVECATPAQAEAALRAYR